MKRGCSWTLLAVSVLLKRENLVIYFLFIKHKNVFYQAILRAKNLYLKQKIFWCLGKKSPFFAGGEARRIEKVSQKHTFCSIESVTVLLKSLGWREKIERKEGHLFIYETVKDSFSLWMKKVLCNLVMEL